ncbi:hypothetical protein AB751O23_AX_00100 [Chlamydiales bacterium SCGC AB-751-O23]|nr:hypothetical protein AB751O23_AX_00100 [Chlamydiales bacterium SCGC AB-751-O23]
MLSLLDIVKDKKDESFRLSEFSRKAYFRVFYKDSIFSLKKNKRSL